MEQKPFVQKEAPEGQVQGRDPFQQPFQHVRQGLARMHKVNRQGQSDPAPHDIGGRTAVKVGGAGASLATTNPVVRIRFRVLRVDGLDLSIVGLIMQVAGDLLRPRGQTRSVSGSPARRCSRSARPESRPVVKAPFR